MSSNGTKTRRRKSGKKLNKITFDTETITKDTAQHTLHKRSHDSVFTLHKKQNLPTLDKETTPNDIQSKSRKAKAEVKDTPPLNVKPKAEKKQKNTKTNESEQVSVLQQTEDQDTVQPGPKKEDSKRTKKRKKHEELLLQKKLKVDTEMCEKCLNYLSRWKHDRNNWKFEKLRQIWLQQNMYDSEKITDKFWNILLEYFENSKGHSRHKIIDDALKHIERNEQCGETTEDGSVNTDVLKRARDVIQYLNTL